MGCFRAWINGKRLGKAVIDQPWSQYDKRIYATPFDVTHLLREGPNAMGVQLGASFWSVPKPPEDRYYKGDALPDFSEGRPWLLSVELKIETEDGRVQVIQTGSDWTWAPSPMTFSHIQAGEDWDARQEVEAEARSGSWLLPAYRKTWDGATVAKAPLGVVTDYAGPAITTHEVFAPTKVLERPGAKGGSEFSYVFPQNVSGIVRFEVEGPAGSTVEFVPSEAISEQGDVQQLNLWGREMAWKYTLSGRGRECHEVYFTYHGFQFVKVRGAVPVGRPNPNHLPVLRKLESVHVRTDVPEVGSFTCSSELFNRIHKLVDWAFRSNMSFVLTDCPHREKLGWLECSYLLAPSFFYRFDCDGWMRKIAEDLADAQLTDGTQLTVAPWFLQLPPDNPFAFTVEWGAAAVLTPWERYAWYGDQDELRRSYPHMKAYVGAVMRRSPEFIAPQGLGDWYDYGHGQPPGPSRFTPTDLTSTASFALCVQALAQAARELGLEDDARKNEAVHARIKEAFWQRFYDPSTQTLKNSGSVQSGHAMALEADLVPAEFRHRVLQAILDDLASRDMQQTAGDVGHVYFIRALSRAGRSDVLGKVYARTGTGSYGGILAKGLTTMPETWDAMTAGSNSLNHAMLGHIMEWLYGYVGGIRPQNGWRTFVIAPEPSAVPGADAWANVRLKSPQGLVACSWKRKGAKLHLDVVVPKRSTARLILPEGYRTGKTGAMSFRAETTLGPGSWTVVASP